MSEAKVLILGNGGREHAIAWSLQRSPRVGQILCAPGNAGIAAIARCLPVDLNDLDAMVQLAVSLAPDLTIIGPEAPLALGIVNELERRGLRVFGPRRAAAELETSKAFAKRFMQRHNIPTANYAVCTSKDEAEEALSLFSAGLVVKANGLHAGKGVLLCKDHKQARAAIEGLFQGTLLGTPETSIVLEELLHGEELSFLLMSDGKHIAPLLPAQDHKRIGEGDTGLNTGGMGAYTADSMLPLPMQDWILHRIAQPTIDGMAAESTPFIGVLFIGLMMTARGPMVLEYNTRFGDPETQAILLRLESDLYEAFEACVEGRLSETEFRWSPGAGACIVAASPGYPGKYPIGLPIQGLTEAAATPETQIFHAGTALVNDQVQTAGGRVLSAAAAGPTLQLALHRAYAALGSIQFEGIYYRHDIGRLGLDKETPVP